MILLKVGKTSVCRVLPSNAKVLERSWYACDTPKEERRSSSSAVKTKHMLTTCVVANLCIVQWRLAAADPQATAAAEMGHCQVC